MKAFRGLVLLGVAAQGLASQEPAWAPVFVLLGLLLAWLRRGRPVFGPRLETLLFAVGLLLAFKFRSEEMPLFITLGFALLFLQLNRLPEALEPRRRATGIALALLHLTIASLSVFDWTFVLVLLAALLLVPRALIEQEQARLGVELPLGWLRQLRLAGGLSLLMILIFPILPRAGQRGGGFGLAPRMLDAASSGSASSARPLFRIEGEGPIGYLRIWTLDRFDGNQWSMDIQGMIKSSWLPESSGPPNLRRRVEWLDLESMNSMTPVDGRVAGIKSQYASKPYLSVDGDIAFADPDGPRGSEEYEYWIEPNAPPEPLSPEARQRFLQLSSRSERLVQWIAQVVGSESDPVERAEKLAMHLKDNFEYDLGAPALDRLSPVEDFLFVEKRGHCERFASALAVLLRLDGTPARVAMGYLPQDSSKSGNVYTILAKHGHAWTEAYFEGEGWTRLDATPYGNSPYGLPQPLWRSWYEWAQSMWYQKVVFFGAAERRQLWSTLANGLRSPLAWLGEHGLHVTAAALGLAALLWLNPLRRLRAWRRTPAEQASHFYGRMLRLLARRGLRRPPSQTPLEFLALLRERRFGRIEEAHRITEAFCQMRYGGKPIPPSGLRELEQALRRIKKG